MVGYALGQIVELFSRVPSYVYAAVAGASCALAVFLITRGFYA